MNFIQKNRTRQENKFKTLSKVKKEVGVINLLQIKLF